MVEEGGPTSFRPPAGAFDRTAHDAEVGDRRRADIEHHLDVGTDLGLDIDRPLRGEEVGRAVVGRFERGTLVGQFGAEGEDLVAARIGEDVTAPVGHAVDATERFDDISPGSHHEVVRVGQDDLGAECFDVARIEMHDRPAGADRHETWGRELATSRGHHAAAGLPISGRLDETRTHRPDATGPRTAQRSSNMASPKLRKR